MCGAAYVVCLHLIQTQQVEGSLYGFALLGSPLFGPPAARNCSTESVGKLEAFHNFLVAIKDVVLGDV